MRAPLGWVWMNPGVRIRSIDLGNRLISCEVADAHTPQVWQNDLTLRRNSVFLSLYHY